MGMLSIQGAGDEPGYVPDLIIGSLGQTQTISQQEITNDLLARGYRKAYAVPISPPASPVIRVTTPTMTRAEAIKKALDYILNQYRLSPRCTRLGGCALTESRFTSISIRGAALATSYLRAGSVATRAPSFSPVPTSPSTSPAFRLFGGISPAMSGIAGDLHGLGLVQISPVTSTTQPTFPGFQQMMAPETTEQPGMTRWDWVAIISNAAQGVASTLEAYANAQAQRQRVGQTATLTAAQVKTIVNEAIIQNPTLNKTNLIAAAKGAAGDIMPKGMPGWVLPVVIGSAVVVVVGFMKK